LAPKHPSTGNSRLQGSHDEFQLGAGQWQELQALPCAVPLGGWTDAITGLEADPGGEEIFGETPGVGWPLGLGMIWIEMSQR